MERHKNSQPTVIAARLEASPIACQCFTFDCADRIGERVGFAMEKLHDKYAMRNYVAYSNRDRQTIHCVFGYVAVRFFAERGLIQEMKLSQNEDKLGE